MDKTVLTDELINEAANLFAFDDYLLVGDYDPSEGLTATITSSIGATIDPSAASHHLVVKDGAFLYNNDTDIAEATDLTNRSIVFTKAIKDGGGYEADENFGSRGARVGDTVILTGTGSSTPIVTTILKISMVANVGFAKIIVGNTGSLTALTSVGFCATLDATYEEGANTFTYSDGTLTISGGLKAVIDDISAETEGTLQSGTFYFEYREALTKYVGKLGVVSSFNDLYEQLGPWCADNPLSLACYFALAGGRAVYYTGVSEKTGEAYATALDSLSQYTELYSIVPATEDTAIIEACMAYCESVSNDEDNVVRRALWYGVTADKEIKLWSGTATISGTTVTVSENSDDVYLDTNLQAGDVIAKASDTSVRWTITAVGGPTSLTIAAGATVTSSCARSPRPPTLSTTSSRSAARSPNARCASGRTASSSAAKTCRTTRWRLPPPACAPRNTATGRFPTSATASSRWRTPTRSPATS